MKTPYILLIVLLSLQMCNNDEKKPVSKSIKLAFQLAEDEIVDGYEMKEMDSTKIYLNSKIEINEKDIDFVIKSFDNQMEMPIIMLEMNQNGARKFTYLTTNNIGKKLAIVLNGKILMAPVIRDKIEGGKVQITGNFTSEKIDEMFKTLTEN